MDGSGLLGGGAVPATPPGADPSVFDRSAAAETSDGARHAAAQLHALTRKNALILLRRRRSTLAYVALPSLAILGLWALEAGVRAWLTGHPGALEDGSGAPLAPLAVRPCRVFDRFGHPVDAPCTTAMFAPATPNTIAIMRNFAAATGLEYGSDVVAAASTRAVADAVAHHPGTVDAAVIFACTDCPTPDSVGSVDAAWGPAGPDDAPALTCKSDRFLSCVWRSRSTDSLTPTHRRCRRALDKHDRGHEPLADRRRPPPAGPRRRLRPLRGRHPGCRRGDHRARRWPADLG